MGHRGMYVDFQAILSSCEEGLMNTEAERTRAYELQLPYTHTHLEAQVLLWCPEMPHKMSLSNAKCAQRKKLIHFSWSTRQLRSSDKTASTHHPGVRPTPCHQLEQIQLWYEKRKWLIAPWHPRSVSSGFPLEVCRTFSVTLAELWP